MQSPYQCTFGRPKVTVQRQPADSAEEAEEAEGDGGGGLQLRLSCLGKAVRRRDIPTMVQQKAQERAQRGVAADVSAEGECEDGLWH